MMGATTTLGIQSSGAQHGLLVTTPAVQTSTPSSSCAEGVYPTSNPRYAKLELGVGKAGADEVRGPMFEG